MAVLPISTKIRGPAPIACTSPSRLFPLLVEVEGLRKVLDDADARDVADPNTPDVIEEALDLFRANCLFRNFEIKGE